MIDRTQLIAIASNLGISDELKNKIIDRLNVPQKPTRDQIKEQQKAYREAHKEEIREQKKAYREAHRPRSKRMVEK